MFVKNEDFTNKLKLGNLLFIPHIEIISYQYSKIKFWKIIDHKVDSTSWILGVNRLIEYSLILQSIRNPVIEIHLRIFEKQLKEKNFIHDNNYFVLNNSIIMKNKKDVEIMELLFL